MAPTCECGVNMSAPIFVGGANRSGKTLMRWILSAHSTIDITRRSEMWHRYAGRFGRLDRTANLERCIAAMAGRRQIKSLAPDWDQVRREFARGEPTYARLFSLVHQQHAARLGKTRWGDQAGLIERFFDNILDGYPEMRLVHLVRDPRDRYAAIVQRDGRSRRGLKISTDQWVLSARLAIRNAERRPDACKVVRYETLVTRPTETVRDVCGFVGETFEPEMVRLPGVRRYDDVREASPDGSPITSADVGRFTGQLDRRDLSYIQAEAGRLLPAFGYQPVPVDLRTRDRLVTTILGPRRRSERTQRDALGGLGPPAEEPRQDQVRTP